jgi:hypothetical protein
MRYKCTILIRNGNLDVGRRIALIFLEEVGFVDLDW